ncbi:unnamed protein product [Meganyctiphanes norvegica]|uniref:Uncharacterized protein n=1 Tax=Meganyctiphanes norvegica TaxID=48144 RepID=A0AAV2RV56_MEGNR
MASPFPFVRTNTKMGSMRYSVPTGITKFHSFANSLVNQPTSLGSYSVPRTTQGTRRDSTYYPHINLGSRRASSEMPFMAPSRCSSIDPSYRFTVSRLKNHTLNYLSMV